MKMGRPTAALVVGCNVGGLAVMRCAGRHAAGQKKIAAKKMGPTTVAHSGGRRGCGRHVGRWAVVRAGVRNAAGQKKVASKKMGPAKVAHSDGHHVGGRHVGGRHVVRWSVVCGGVHLEAMRARSSQVVSRRCRRSPWQRHRGPSFYNTDWASANDGVRSVRPPPLASNTENHSADGRAGNSTEPVRRT